MTLVLTGIGVAKGLAVGKVYILQYNGIEVSERKIPDALVEAEVERYKAALDAVRQQLRALREKIPSYAPLDIFAFINIHLLMLEDSALAKAPVQLIRERGCNAEWALYLQREVLFKAFEGIEDPYLRARKEDLTNLVNRLLRTLIDGQAREQEDTASRFQDKIILADEVAPADLVLMHDQGAAAFVTESGGPTSHTSILARGLGIPMLVGMRHARSYVRHHEWVVVDGNRGAMLAGADEPFLTYYRRQQEEKSFAGADVKRKRPSVTRDSVTVSLQANIDRPEDVPALKEAAAEGVGLYRTEYLFLNRSAPPDEEEQLEAYVRVVQSLRGAPVTIRTFDLGGDKQLGGQRAAAPTGANPALGLRAIRLSLKDPALFRPQLRAILRASAYGPARIMIPMLSSLHELSQVLHIVEESKRELEKKGLRYDENIQIGGMIEVPAAALAAEAFARRLDFLSIGTNDLIQYTIAADRIDEEVNYLYDPLHPAVLRLIHMTLRAARRRNIPVSMCGEMAGDVRYTRLLLGMGLTEFSMHPSSLSDVKVVIQASDVGDAEKWVRKILRNLDPHRIEAYLESLNAGLDM